MGNNHGYATKYTIPAPCKIQKNWLILYPVLFQ